jgi:hypothetical protein
MNTVVGLTPSIKNDLFDDGDEREPEALPSFSLAGGLYLREANIGTDLEPLTRDYIGAGSRVQIVGNDGANIFAKDYPWPGILDLWLSKGCDVDYLLLNPSRYALSVLGKVAGSHLENDDGTLAVFQVKGDCSPTKDVADYLRQWERFHFAVFENPKQLWIESCHEPGRTSASDCYYFNPEEAEKSPLLEVYKSRFEYVVENCCDQVV